MKKLYSFFAGLFLVTAVAQAQPCSNFNDPVTPQGNWIPSGVAASYGDTNPLDGTHCARLADLSGTSRYTNSVDFKSLGKKYTGQCICFDFFLLDDGGFGGSYHPFIILGNGTQEIIFQASTGVVQGNGWIHVCAPLTHCSGTTMPSNADGAWNTLTAGMTCTDFNNVMDNVTYVSVTPDITNSPTEIVLFDNICVKDCGGCSADFELKTSYSSLSNNVTANVGLINPSGTATYTVNWGDGTAITAPSVQHVYTNPGTYTVCVSQMVRETVICTKCITFCVAGNKQTTVAQKSVPLPDLIGIGNAELKAFGNGNGAYSLYPNPADKYAIVNIELGSREVISIKVKDMLGKSLTESTGTYNEGSQQIKINTEKLTPGIYNVEIHVGNKVSTQKLSISK